MRKPLFLLLLTIVSALASPAQAKPEYVPGRGLRFFDGQLVLGGYLAADLAFMDESRDQLILDDVSAFLTYNPTDELEFFTEFEIEDGLHLDGHGFGTGEDVTQLERLYLEYRPFDDLSIRVGKVLTPIGIWNPIHAAPLVWTTSRPFATNAFFDTHLTGLQIEGRRQIGALDLVANLFGQATNQLDKSDVRQRMRRGGGGRIQIGNFDHWHVAGSYLRFQDDRDRKWKHVAGIDVLFENDDWEITTESVLSARAGHQTEWSTYLQVVYHLGKFHPVVRYEHVEFQHLSRNPMTFGVAYKPLPNMVIKLEGVVGRRDFEKGARGVLMSFSVLF
ncbi:MAG: hypothetical protein ACE5FA_00745 [Dehalococcoidia bacterium]